MIARPGIAAHSNVGRARPTLCFARPSLHREHEVRGSGSRANQKSRVGVCFHASLAGVLGSHTRSRFVGLAGPTVISSTKGTTQSYCGRTSLQVVNAVRRAANADDNADDVVVLAKGKWLIREVPSGGPAISRRAIEDIRVISSNLSDVFGGKNQMFAALAKKDLFEGLLQKFRFTSRAVFICLVGEMVEGEDESNCSQIVASSTSSNFVGENDTADSEDSTTKAEGSVVTDAAAEGAASADAKVAQGLLIGKAGRRFIGSVDVTARTAGDNGPDDGCICTALDLKEGDRYAYVTSMAVPIDMRRQGVGQCLMEGVEKAALSFDPPCGHAVLHVFEDNDNARSVRWLRHSRIVLLLA